MRRCAAWLSVVLLALPAGGGEGEGPPPIDGKAILDHLKWLSDDERQGRAAGSPGEEAAGVYIAQRLEALGLKGLGKEGSFFQEFSLPKGFDIRPETRLVAEREGRDETVEFGDDLKPLTLSSAGEVTAPALFAGYGIAAPELGYDDYEGIDAKGKVVVVLRHAPAYEDRKSPFKDPETRRRYAVFEAKVRTAVGAGAAALVIVNDPENVSKPKEDVAMHDVGGDPSGIPVFHVTLKAGRRLGKVLGLNLQREQNAIDKGLKPRSRDLDGATLSVHALLDAKRLPVRNICGLLEAPRTAEGAREALVVGAHYDHVGLGAYGSLAGSKGDGAIHNGADDNASGSSSLLEVAAFLAARRNGLRRDVLILFFTAEELGLLGSKHYVESPLVPLEQCVAMVNLDMVGRLERGKLQVGGTGTSPIFPELLESKNRAHRIDCKFNPGGRAPSDNTSFYEKGMPVLFFFTGLHKDYHRPSDDWKGIDRKGIERVARLAADVCLDLATRETRPPFTRSDATGLDMGPFLGLSLEQRQDGVYVIFIEDKSPADRARFQVGDKVEEFEKNPIRSLTSFNQVHGNCTPGQKVVIAVRRGPRLLNLTAILGKD